MSSSVCGGTPFGRGLKIFFVRFHMEVLPVKAWEEKKGFFLPWGTKCVICPFAETLQQHLLVLYKCRIILGPAAGGNRNFFISNMAQQEVSRCRKAIAQPHPGNINLNWITCNLEFSY
ncbi:unnamed protein product [Ixodes hexagonus]